MGGGFIDNMWDPYSGAYPYYRPRYYRPGAPVYDRYGSKVEPEDRYSYKVEEPVKKHVRTIPVTDASAPVAPVKVETKVPVRPVAVSRFGSGDAAATKIQAVYRGYAVRKTEPLKHLRIIEKVKEELEGFKGKLQGSEQKKKLCRDAQERLRWTEGVMALLLRLDTLQGVHPDVRVIRKALTKELIWFQEMIDSMAVEAMELDGEDDVITAQENGSSDVAKEEVKVIDAVAPEVVKEVQLEENAAESANTYDVAEEEAEVIDAVAPEGLEYTEIEESSAEDTNNSDVTKEEVELIDVFTPEIVKEMDVEESTTEELSGVDEDSVIEVWEYDSHGRDINSTENSTSENHVPQVHLDTNDQVIDSVATCSSDERELLPGPVNESTTEEGFVLVEPGSTEAPMDVENKEKILMTHPAEDVEVELGSSQNVSPTGVDKREVLQVDISEENASDNDDAKLCGQASGTGRGEEAEKMAECTDRVDGCIIPAGVLQSMSLEPACKSFQVSQPDDNSNALSDRALLLQVLEENRRLKNVVGKVLQWGKQQNDVIHNLACRIEQLEQHQPPSKLLHGEEDDGRKNIAGRRSEAEGRRNGTKGGSRLHLGYVDSEDWLSAESDDYF